MSGPRQFLHVFGQSVGIAFAMLRLHKLRAFLTMLGVIIGVMSVTLIVMISSGFRLYINEEFSKFGADTLFLMYDPGGRMRGQSLGGIEGLTLDDIQYVLDRCETIGVASAAHQMEGQVARAGAREARSVSVMAGDESFQELNRYEVISGRPLTEADHKGRANVCIISEDLRDRLFPNQDPIGGRVTLARISFEVVGVMKNMEFLGQSMGRAMVVPLTTALDKWIGGDNIMMITMRPKPGYTVDQAMDDVWRVMMNRTDNRPVYRVDSRQSFLELFQAVVGAAGILLAAIAALSLLVGGIGIMNIMLVSVTERTREIGLRMAVGAQRPAILIQFLVEAGVLSLVGGVIGMLSAMALGYGGALLLKVAADLTIPVAFPWMAGIGALVFSAAVGMVFGLFPAWSAARLDPIVALRSE
ncbi:MAG: ABC transporter permease [Armatimonadota bacterium]